VKRTSQEPATSEPFFTGCAAAGVIRRLEKYD
jgi:hypothetical protein